MLPLLILLVTLTCFLDTRENDHAVPLSKHLIVMVDKDNVITDKTISHISPINLDQKSFKAPTKSLNEIKAMLHKKSIKITIGVINIALIALQCARKYNIEHNNLLTIIDYSLPSNIKRLWIFNLATTKLLFHTYVSHGIKSGTLLSQSFSNIVNSKASSIGIYNTEKSYYGRHGLSLKLHGLDRGFNNNAYRRFVVMHGAWYMREHFIKKYGRAGRSWGCPTLPPNLTKPIINAIKDKTLLIIYYPGNEWFLKSKFLNCDEIAKQNVNNLKTIVNNSPMQAKEVRGKILFADLNNNNKREGNEPIVVVKVENYQKTFENKVPLNRMLRRQINKIEYIALTNSEFQNIYTNHNNDNAQGLKSIYFVIPTVKMLRGYYATEMKIINMGTMKRVRSNIFTSNKNKAVGSYTVYFEGKPSIILKSTKRFIRWLGL